MKRKKIRVISIGGIGDVILSTPIYQFLKKQKYCKVVVFCVRPEHKEIYQGNPHIDELRDIRFISNPVYFIQYYLKLARFYTFYYGQLAPSLSYKTQAAVLMGEMMDVKVEDTRVQLYLTKEEEEKAAKMMSGYRNPIIIHPASLTSKNQEWPMENWETLIKELPDYTFIQLGSGENEKIGGAIDLRDKTTLREAIALIKYAKGFVGINSAFSHVTNAFDIRGVVLFGPSNPDIWGHSNNINLYNKLRCSPCIDLLLDASCPYGKPCMHSITVREVKEALLTQLQEKKYAELKVNHNPLYV